MTAPAFSLLDADADDALDALPPDATDAQRDAYVSELLRKLGEAKADVQRDVDALALLHANLDRRYAILMKPRQERVARYEAAICEIARVANFGRARSREVGYGTYGVKRVPERVRVVDEPALVDFAHDHAPELVRMTIRHDVSAKALKDYYHTTGDIPPGVEVIAAHDEPYARPALPQEGA